jgi:BMFP domain-containing protein YqiC
VFNLVAVVDEELREEFNSSIASVLTTSRQENAALESEINTHIDASVAEIN